MSQQGGQTHATCCAQQCCDMLSWHVAIVWPGLIIFNNKIIPRTRVGYEVIDSQLGASRLVGYNHLISNKRVWNNCFIKNHQQILLAFADFAWLKQPEGSLMDAISRVSSYTIAAKPIKTLVYLTASSSFHQKRPLLIPLLTGLFCSTIYTEPKAPLPH